MGKLLLSTILVFSSFFIFSQDKGAIRGTITDADMFNEPIIFAHISLKNTSHTVQTNFHGQFELTDIAPGNYTLSVQYPGYMSLEIPVNVREELITTVDQSMRTLELSLNEVLKNEIVSSANIAESPVDSDK